MTIKSCIRSALCCLALIMFSYSMAYDVQPKSHQQMKQENIKTESFMKERSNSADCLYNPHIKGTCDKCSNWCKQCNPKKDHKKCIEYGCDGCN